MADKQNFMALEWVAKEITGILDQAARILDLYEQNPGNQTLLQMCFSLVHEVHASLKMLDLDGVTMLAEEIENLIQAKLSHGVISEQEAIEVLKTALEQFPRYLATVQHHCRDIPLQLVPLVNDLRIIRGEKLLGRKSAWLPDFFTEYSEQEVSVSVDNNLAEFFRKIRQRFQIAQLALFSRNDVDTNLDVIHKIFAHLTLQHDNRYYRPLWLASQAVAAGLLAKEIPLTVSIKALFRNIDREFKRLQESVVPVLLPEETENLLQNMLVYAARCPASHSAVIELDQRYNLIQLLGGNLEVVADQAAQQAMTAAVNSLLDELAATQSKLESCTRNYLQKDRVSLNRIQQNLLEHPEASIENSLALLARSFKDLADTAALLGFQEEAIDIGEQSLLLQSYARQGQPLTVEQSLQIAEHMLAIELSIVTKTSTNQMGENANSDPVAVALREARTSLESIKQAINDYLNGTWDVQLILGVPSQLRSIRGVALMLDIPQLAALLQGCAQYVEDHLLDQEFHPDLPEMNALADSICAVDYYLEQCQNKSASPDKSLLSRARLGLDRLGIHVIIPDMEPEYAEPESEFEKELELEDAPEEEIINELEALDVNDLQNSDEIDLDFIEKEFAAALAEEDADFASTLEEDEPEPEPEPELVDPEIVEVFLEEMDEVLKTIHELLPLWQLDPDNKAALIGLRRAFHTLKGSGRMVGAQSIGELTWSVEQAFNSILDGLLKSSQGLQDTVTEVVDLLPELAMDFTTGSQHHHERAEHCKQILERLLRGEDVFAEISARQSEKDELLEPGAEQQEADPLLQIFITEAQSHLDVLGKFISQCREDQPLAVDEGLYRALHTLRGGASSINAVSIVEVIEPLDEFVRKLSKSHLVLSQNNLTLLADCYRFIEAKIYDLNIGQLDQGSAAKLIDRLSKEIERLDNETEEYNKVFEEIADNRKLLRDTIESLMHAGSLLSAWQRGVLSRQELENLLYDLERFCTNADLFPLHEAADLGFLIRQACQQVMALEKAPDTLFFQRAENSYEALLEVVDHVVADQNPRSLADHITIWQNYLEELARQPASSIVETVESEDLAQIFATEPAWEPESEPASEPVPVMEERAADAVPAEVLSYEQLVEIARSNLSADDLDADILKVFLEEADDILESTDNLIHLWTEDKDNREYLDSLQRSLHTLKGGARMAGLTYLGDISHEFESYLITQELQFTQFDKEFFARIQQHYDHILATIEVAKNWLSDPAGLVVPDSVESDIEESKPVVESVAASVQTAEEKIESIVSVMPRFSGINLARALAGDIEELADQAATTSSRERTPQELVRVSAKMLDDLVNLAGETSISRARIEEQVNDFGLLLEEMDNTLHRLQGLMRRLDIETEAQILFRKEQYESSGAEEFDPLEMDRYSKLQQLSRSLVESASDLKDLKGTLTDKTRDMETLLLQQSRINTELQEGLMRSRMEPFSRIAPRLRRIVRQVSKELNKQVDFRIGNIEGELDRSVLERIVHPLEHMIRNAIDHGIEASDARLAVGKPESGRLTLNVHRYGGEVIITLADDGAGVNFDKVRSKAIALGLLTADAHLSEQEVLKVIFQPGFSTAGEITQISGRGVGMDVVQSEIKQLGGTIDIQSEPGKGTLFTIHLPFTVSINRALMVVVGAETYAIPLNTIEGIVQVSPQELEAHYSGQETEFRYAGQSYLIRYMGSFLHSSTRPNLKGRQGAIPVLLVRTGLHAVAVQIDGLLGSREIVVKTLGPQFSLVPGLSGATLLGDGSVVVILDLLAMIRQDDYLHKDHLISSDHAVQPEADQRKTVMVVDDSVTVRKVTGRFLEREGMKVMLAKDGADAILQLQETIPDIMLLDIEMPRMDGFEVLQKIRFDEKLKHIPIIMITSRTGDKHTQRAYDLGVNDYMGKPYRETELLERINRLLAEHEVNQAVPVHR